MDYSNNVVANLIQSSRAKEVKFIIVKDIIENQNQGRLDFTISDESINSVVLSAVHVDSKAKEIEQKTSAANTFVKHFT